MHKRLQPQGKRKSCNDRREIQFVVYFLCPWHFSLCVSCSQMSLSSLSTELTSASLYLEANKVKLN